MVLSLRLFFRVPLFLLCVPGLGLGLLPPNVPKLSIQQQGLWEIVLVLKCRGFLELALVEGYR